MLGRIPLASVGLVLGSILIVVGLAAYFADNATLNLAGFFYGFPLLLGGLALKSSELKPLSFSQPTTPELLALRKEKATITQNKLRRDVTRYRYGQVVHLDQALKFLGLSNKEEDTPTLKSLRETTTEGAYTLVLEFDSPQIPLTVWQQKHEKMTKFFGPGVRLEITQPQENKVDIALIVAG